MQSNVVLGVGYQAPKRGPQWQYLQHLNRIHNTIIEISVTTEKLFFF